MLCCAVLCCAVLCCAVYTTTFKLDIIIILPLYNLYLEHVTTNITAQHKSSIVWDPMNSIIVLIITVLITVPVRIDHFLTEANKEGRKYEEDYQRGAT